MRRVDLKIILSEHLMKALLSIYDAKVNDDTEVLADTEHNANDYHPAKVLPLIRRHVLLDVEQSEEGDAYSNH